MAVGNVCSNGWGIVGVVCVGFAAVFLIVASVTCSYYVQFSTFNREAIDGRCIVTDHVVTSRDCTPSSGSKKKRSLSAREICYDGLIVFNVEDASSKSLVFANVVKKVTEGAGSSGKSFN